MKTRIKSGIAQRVTGARQKYVQVATKTHTYVLEESEPDRYYLRVAPHSHKGKRIDENDGPFELCEGLGNLLLDVLVEEAFVQNVAKGIPPKKGCNGI